MNGHKHVLRNAFKKDTGLPYNEQYDKGERWLKLWACIVKGCTYTEAYDLTHEQPVRKD